VKRIDVLPDDVLLEIFYFYVDMSLSYKYKKGTEAWQSLVHVCRRWRSLVLGSPRRLNLRLYCTPKTPAKDTLDVWPALPIIVEGGMTFSGTDNIIAALGQSNRICEVDLLYVEGWQLEKVLAAMQVPFPELTYLKLFSVDETLPVIPNSFLGGSAPRLQHFYLLGVPYPGLPKLLLSANHLVTLWLSNIPHSGYISPGVVVTLLSVLSSLRIFCLEFQSRTYRESRSLPPPKRSILPALTGLYFKGVTEYLEELVSRIDTPKLDKMHITFFNQIDFDCPQLAQFINRTPTRRARNNAHVQFDDYSTSVALLARRFKTLEIEISCRGPHRQLSSVAQVCNSPVHPPSTVEDLYIERRFYYLQLDWKNDAIENTLWLQLLLPFTAVKNLYLSKEFAPGIAVTLQELVGGRIAEVLPSLEIIFVEGLNLKPSGPVEENIWQFVAARQLSGHPIAISDWDNDPDMEPV
jgi:F-box-like